MTDVHPDTCVQCGCELKYWNFDIDMLADGIDLPVCPNPACPNYGLVTVGRSGVDNG
jgi:hypothetical protein